MIAIERVVIEEMADIRRSTDTQRVIHIITGKMATNVTEMSDAIEDMKTDQTIGLNEKIMDLIIEIVIEEEEIYPKVKVGVEVEVETDIHILPVPDMTSKAVLKEKPKSKKWSQIN